MNPGGLAAWPPLALLLLWLPGPSVRAWVPGLCFSDCVPLSCPSEVTGTVGGSLSVQCHYGEEFKDKAKSWCKTSLIVRCKDIVKTEDSEREVRSGRMSISDHPANLSLTVTMENLTLGDAGSYECQVHTLWLKVFNPSFRVEVAVLPARTETPTSVTTAETLTIPTKTQAVLSTSLVTESTSPGPGPDSSSQDLYRGQDPGLPVLVSLLALLLLLLVGSSLLAWRKWQKQAKAGGRSELSQDLRQAAEQSEPCYANLQMRSLREEPAPPKQAEVEYSMLAHAREDLHYTSVVFDPQRRDSSANGVPCRRPREKETEYSVIRDSLLSPHP